MSQQYDNTNKGVLFINDRKERDSHPDRKGSINIDGKEYWLSAWNKTTARGDTISISVQAKDAAKNSQQAPQQSQAANNSFQDDDVPF
jgi:hypothetical protein